MKVFTCQHLVDEDAEGPPVDGQPVPLALHDLGREVLGRAAERSRCVAVMNILLAQPEIGDLYVTIVVKQEVLQLKYRLLCIAIGH